MQQYIVKEKIWGKLVREVPHVYLKRIVSKIEKQYFFEEETFHIHLRKIMGTVRLSRDRVGNTYG